MSFGVNTIYIPTVLKKDGWVQRDADSVVLINEKYPGHLITADTRKPPFLYAGDMNSETISRRPFKKANWMGTAKIPSFLEEAHKKGVVKTVLELPKPKAEVERTEEEEKKADEALKKLRSKLKQKVALGKVKERTEKVKKVMSFLEKKVRERRAKKEKEKDDIFQETVFKGGKENIYFYFMNSKGYILNEEQKYIGRYDPRIEYINPTVPSPYDFEFKKEPQERLKVTAYKVEEEEVDDLADFVEFEFKRGKITITVYKNKENYVITKDSEYLGRYNPETNKIDATVPPPDYLDI